MRRATTAAMTGLLAAACASQASPAPAPPPPVADASKVDMCAILTDPELTSLGVQPSSRKSFNTSGVIGCRWQGKSYTLSMERANSTLAGYRAHRNDPSFINFADNTVNGRAGSHFGVDKSGSQCAQLMDGGSAALSVSVAFPRNAAPAPVDPCAEALRIAQMVEPRLPKLS
ncbi:MAG TPA: DUF3558 family protein [Pseudonocardiaceae bacterium]|jgi:hypothetical protein|nr:DUF3558 family protein [Pseudonocardiaceae bacterium]